MDPPAPCPPADAAPAAQSGRLEWPKRMLQQTNLVSGIAAKIESNINRADWDADCYEGCRRLLMRETQRMGAVSDDRGLEEIPVLVELEVQHWVDEALENATRATERILARVASMGVRHPSLDQEEASDFDLTTSRAAQTVMRTVTAYPLSDAQLERVVKLALGKRILAASTTTASENLPQATTLAARPASDRQTGPEVVSESEGENRTIDGARPEGSRPARGVIQPTSPGLVGAVEPEPSEESALQPPGGDPSIKMMTAVPGGKKNRAARRAARAALEANSGSPAAEGDQTSLSERPRQCPVFGCTREHAPGDCPIFLDMTLKERLDLVQAKQLCLLCLQHPLSMGCEVAGEGSCCPANGCGRPHHVALHGVLKAGKSFPQGGDADPPDEPTSSADCWTLETARQLRGLLEGLGIDPGALEVRIGVRNPGEPGRPCGGDAIDPDAAEDSGFVNSAAGNGQRGIGMVDPAGAPKRSAREDRSRSATRSVECTPRRNSGWMGRQEPARQGDGDDADEVGERRRTLDSSEYARSNQGGRRGTADSSAWCC